MPKLTPCRIEAAMPKFTLNSLLSRQPQEPIMQTPDYTCVFANAYLRKQKCSELRDFLSSDTVYAIVEGPPGSLKTACVQRVAAELNYAVREFDVYCCLPDDDWQDKQGVTQPGSRTLAPRLLSTDMADIAKGNDGRKVVTLVCNVGLAKNPATWVLPKRTEKTAKVIFELHDTPKEMAPLVRQKIVRKISFGPVTEKSMQMIAAAIAFRNPPRAALQCGDANQLYIAAMTQSVDAWKDTQLSPFREAEEVIRERREEMLNWKTPFLLQQHCHKFMSLEAHASFLEDVAIADTITFGRRKNWSATDDDCDLHTSPFLAISARLHTDRMPSRIDWSGELNALKRPRRCLQEVAVYARCRGLTLTDARLRLYSADHALQGTKIGEPGATATAKSEEPEDTAAAEGGEREAKRRRLEGPEVVGESPSAMLPPPRPVQVGGASGSGGDVVAVRADTVATPVGLAAFKYEDRVLVASDAKRYSVWLANPFVRPEAQGGSLKDFVRDFRLEEKRDLPTNFRKFTLLLFKPAAGAFGDAHFTVEGFWTHFAETIGLRPESHEDGIAVCTLPELRNVFAVAYHKSDQRHITVPDGFWKRYVQAATKKGTTRFAMSDILRRVSNLGASLVTNMRIENLAEQGRRLTSIEAVTAVKNLSPQDLSLQRVAASMKKEKERTDIERALTSGWGATKHALELSEESPIPNRCSIHDTFPVLSSYAPPNAFGAFNYTDIDLDCWVYDAEKDVDIRMRFGEVMQQGLYNRRSFVLAGPPGRGKGWFARALAKELAVLTKDPATSIAELVYLYLTSMQDLAKVEITPEIPVVLDEIYLGETMYHDASPGEYLKDATTVDEHRSLRLLGKWVFLPAFRKIFTTQAKSVERWCQLKRAPSLDKDDIDAVKRRIIWIRYQRLHTEEQKQHYDNERERVTKSQLENICSLRRSGAWK